MKLQKAIEIEILGHKAKIESIRGQRLLEDWDKDQLIVRVTFAEAVGGILSFGVYLPAKTYDRAEFLYNVQLRGEETLRCLLAENAEAERRRQEREGRQKSLDAVAAEAVCLFNN